ncbi:MAG: ABC transporter permease [Methanohalobium sp.]|uniref:ABC transporter permease n=1 Tax=Methanohalobium sp. TaxID=2837493 RepID=UPI00397DB5AE
MRPHLDTMIRGVMTVAEKDIRIYYKKPPVIIFGLIFPLFMFLAFYIGRDMDLSTLFPGFISMALFFTASSVGPLITPWEKQQGTYERLLSYPVNINTILIGDILAGAAFGFMISTAAIVASVVLLGVVIEQIMVLILSLVLGSLCFASLGVLLASPSSQSPSNIMMLSSLVRFPLIFISGIFIPIQELESAGRILSQVSPLTYLVDIFNAGFYGTSVFATSINVLILSAFTLLFVYVASLFHKRNMLKGL